MIRLKTILMSGLIFLGGWTGYKGYCYFCDYTQPCITLEGVHDATWCAGELHCNIFSTKPGSISVWVDENLLIERAAIASNKKPYALTVPTTNFENGMHKLKVICADSSYQQNEAVEECYFIVDNSPLQAAFMDEAKLKVLQGRTLRVQFQVNKEIEAAKVHALAASYDCFAASPEHKIYECYVPISCEEKPNEYLFCVEIKDRVDNKIALDNRFEIVAADFKKQTITVDAAKLEEEKEVGRSEIDLEEALQRIAKNSPKEKLWRGQFCTPIEIERVTCDYGTVRTSQERGRYMHKALDVINTPKSVVWAPQDGIVALKDRFDMSGNTVVVDHGHGILSLFYHLDEFADIQVGQKICKGKPIGTLGKTGYATGYHLHWEMRLANVQVDPMQWTTETFS